MLAGISPRGVSLWGSVLGVSQKNMWLAAWHPESSLGHGNKDLLPAQPEVSKFATDCPTAIRRPNQLPGLRGSPGHLSDGSSMHGPRPRRAAGAGAPREKKTPRGWRSASRQNRGIGRRQFPGGCHLCTRSRYGSRSHMPKKKWVFFLLGEVCSC